MAATSTLSIIFILMLQSLSSYQGLPTDLGCYEISDSSSVFDEKLQASTSWDSNAVTIEKCLLACRFKGYRLAALKDGFECFCGDTFPSVSAQDSCNSPCVGDEFQICGGATAGNVYTVCENGTFVVLGNTCNAECNCMVEDPPCHQVTGKCDSGGCKVNFTGESCIFCIEGNYDNKCSTPCGKCKDISCGRNDGKCNPKGCIDGYHGDKCDMTCGLKCMNDVCVRKNGTCSDGCKAGYHGTKCELKCGNCEGNTCDINDATCTNGCIKGFHGTTCNLDCGKCKDGACDINNGTCPNGCKPGYQGDICKQTCANNTFGQDCSKTCGNCKETCNPVDGKCVVGCEEEWKGDFCNTKCNETGGCANDEECNETGGCTDDKVPDKGGLSTTTVIAIGVGCVFLVIIVICLTICLCKSSRNNQTTKSVADEERGSNSGHSNQGFDLNMVVPLMVQTKPRNSTGPAETPGAQEGGISNDGEISNYVNKYLSKEIALADLGRHIDINVENEGFQKEYDFLPHGLKAESTGDEAKDRFRNIKPYNHNIVRISMIKKDPKSTFINASYIHGYSTQKKFIATQGPKKNTTADFWRMIWEQNVTKIVMVTNLKEFLVAKCEAYWPNSKERYLKYGELRTDIQRVEEKDGFTVRTINLMDVKNTKNIREITQLHFTEWPDNGVPDTPEQVNGFLNHVRELCKDETAPIVVHCSAGVGRTGTIIAMDILTDQAEKENVIDVYKCVNLLRDQRVNMVQTLDQYIFIHRALQDALC